MKLRKIVAPVVLGAFVFALLASPVSAQGPWSTAAFQSWRQGVTAAGQMGAPRFTTALLPTCNAANTGALAFDTTLGALVSCSGTAWASGGTGISLNTAQTPDSMYLATDALSNAFILAESADSTFDFAHAQSTDPTLFIHSHNQNTGQWIGLWHDATNGVVGLGSNIFRMNLGATQNVFAVQRAANPVGVWIPQNGAYAWSTTSDAVNGAGSGAGDLFLTEESAAVLQMGKDVNGAAVNQTLKAHDGVTGSDIAGASLTLESGLGTGAGTSNPLTLNRQMSKATGTTAQTYAPAVIVCRSKILSNTSATTTTVATITTTSTTGGAVTMDYNTLACSGSTCDNDGGIVKVGWNNNAGTVAAAMTAVTLQSDSDATGNITTGPTATVATNVVSIKATPVFTTIVPTTVTFTAVFTVHSLGDTVVCQ